jgi:o-succinylbenzoate---CoA ligase
MYQTNRDQQTLLIENVRYSREEILKEWEFLESPPSKSFRLELFRFLADWFNESEEMTVHTSGSTGEPKAIRVLKTQMMNSACATCSYLHLQPMDKILLCMSLNFIAGKMMVIRALVAGLDLYWTEPSGYPMQKAHGPFKLAAMVPLQIFNSLQKTVEKERLRQIELLLIGGGPLDDRLENVLQDFPHIVYASYGMSETLSHIALRRVNGPEATLWYTPLPSVHLTLSDDQSLIIDAPLVSNGLLYTNDVAELLPDGRFRILGRKDNVINTGGIKIQIEVLESLLSNFIDVPFAVTARPDEKFGEITVLVVEEAIDEKLLMQTLHAKNVAAHLMPKDIQHRAIPRTKNGKVNRTALRSLFPNFKPVR